MATAPEFFDYAAPSQEIEALETEVQQDTSASLIAMLRNGAIGAAITVASLAVVALSDARLSDEAFVRLAGWF